MKYAPIPANEPERLAALHSYEILDTPAEPRFDAIVKLAASILKVPIALVSLVDTDRQWFKARYGIDVLEAPRDSSIGGHVVANDTFLIVPDAKLDDRFADNPNVTAELGHRFYAGAPIRANDGFVLGALCVIDYEPRVLAASEEEALSLLAQQVVEILDLQRRHDQTQKLSQNQLAELEIHKSFFELTPALLCTLDRSLRFELLNAEWEKRMGLSSESMLHGSLLEFVHPEDQGAVQTQIVAMIDAPGSTAAFESRFRRCDGSWLWLSWVVKSNNEGQIYGTARDIGQIKDRHDALQRSNEQLEQFAYVASHDLQEPLRMVASFTQLLSDQYAHELDEKAQKFIGYAVDGAKRMQILISGLLSVARIDSVSSLVESVDTNDAVEQVLISLRPPVIDAVRDSPDEREAKVTFDKLPIISANPVQLGQVFQNLIGNALKFRHESRTIAIHISSRERNDDWVFSVRDNGIGIDRKYQKKIFLIFQRLHERGAFEGSGLGLAICKKIVERHGGEMWLESTPGKGTAFYFSWPKSPAVQGVENQA